MYLLRKTSRISGFIQCKPLLFKSHLYWYCILQLYYFLLVFTVFLGGVFEVFCMYITSLASTHWLFSSILFKVHIFVIFLQFSSCDWFLVSYHHGQKRCLAWFVTLNWEDLFCGLTNDLPFRKFRVHLGKTCIPLLLDEMVCVCLLGPFPLTHCLKQMSPYWCPVWVIYPFMKLRYWSRLLRESELGQWDSRRLPLWTGASCCALEVGAGEKLSLLVTVLWDLLSTSPTWAPQPDNRGRPLSCGHENQGTWCKAGYQIRVKAPSWDTLVL